MGISFILSTISRTPEASYRGKSCVTFSKLGGAFISPIDVGSLEGCFDVAAIVYCIKGS
jgi:hypothetical protein